MILIKALTLQIEKVFLAYQEINLLHNIYHHQWVEKDRYENDRMVIKTTFMPGQANRSQLFIPLSFIKTLLFESLITVTVLISIVTNGQTSEACIECHANMFSQQILKNCVHTPFLLKQCDKCHSTEISFNSDENVTELSKKIRWLKRNLSPALEHWLDFSSIEPGSVLFIEAYSGREVCRQKIILPELDEVLSLPNDHQPPKISDLKIADIHLGVVVTATISWETDTVATSFVNYGQNIAYEFTSDTTCLGRKHQITLTDLKPDKAYLMQVISRDVFGKVSSSKPLQFSTQNNFKADEGETFRVFKASGQKLSISKKLFKVNDRFIMCITASSPIKLIVGALPVFPVKKTITVQHNLPQNHIKLKDTAETCISVCYDCHKEYNKIPTHPVNVGPKLGMIIPAEYPTLPNGKISCISCHSAHAGNREFLLLKSSKKDLCIGCHKDKA